MALDTRSLVCHTQEAGCECALPTGHNGAHRCPCGGSWEIVDGVFHIRAMPGKGTPLTNETALDAFIEMLFGEDTPC